MRAYAIFLSTAIVLPIVSAAAGEFENIEATTRKAPPPIVINAPVDTPPKGARPNPIPRGNPGTWANTSDYPASALAEEREGITGFRATINAEGRVATCTVTLSSGHADLDQATCSNISRRGQFWPALDTKGNPTEGLWSSRVRWQIPAIRSQISQSIIGESFPRPPRLVGRETLSIAPENYPAIAKAEGRQGTTKMALAIDAKGAISDCAVAASSGHADLDRKACETARGWTFEPALNPNGEAVNGRSMIALQWRLPKGLANVAPLTNQPVSNMWSKSGTTTMKMEIDATGKVVTCERTVEDPMGEAEAKRTSTYDYCSVAKRIQYEPFRDKDGSAKARIVTITSSIRFDPVPSSEKGTAAPSSGLEP